MNAREIEKILEQGNNKIISKIFRDLIKEHEPRRLQMIKLYNEYMGELPIKDRETVIGNPEWKSNNKLSNDYRTMIIDQGLAYTFGLPIKYELDESVKSNKRIIETVNNFKAQNKLDDLDFTTSFYAAICGYSARLLYIDEQGATRVMNIKPWEVHFVYSQTIDELQYAMIYYDVNVVDVSSNQSKKLLYVEWYDKENVYYYREISPGSLEFEPDPDNPKNVHPHGFDGVPVIKYKNNDSERGDFEKVRDLIDAYDRLISDAQNELEDYRNAYMIFKGVIPDEETIRRAKFTGAFGSDDKDFEVEFLTKNLNSEFLENHKKTLNENIYKFSYRVDMSDEKFSGAGQSGESRKWKLLALENDAITKEKKFKAATTEMFRLIGSNWLKLNLVPKDFYKLITMQFTRNLPVDLEYYGKIITAFWGKLSIKTIYSLLPFIEDPELELKLKEKEEQEDLDKLSASVNNEGKIIKFNNAKA